MLLYEKVYDTFLSYTLYKSKIFDRDDVCVRNTIEKYGDARYEELTAIFDRQMESYCGSKYHVKDDEVTEFPVFIVSDERKNH